MSDSNCFRIVHTQFLCVSQMIEEAQVTTDVAKAEKLYRRARKQLDVITNEMKSGLARLSDTPQSAAA